MPLQFSAQGVLQSSTGGGALGFAFLVPLLLGLIVIAGMWKTFAKAGEPGWAAIIPIYNIYVMLKIGDNQWWWLLVILFVPILNLLGLYKAYAGVSKAFGQGTAFALGLFFLGFVFFPILGFGDYSYQGQPV